MIIAAAQITRTGFMSRQVLAHPSSPRGFLTQNVTNTIANDNVISLKTACTQVIGKYRKLAAGANVTILAKTGTMKTKAVPKFIATANTESNPCVMRLPISSRLLAG